MMLSVLSVLLIFPLSNGQQANGCPEFVPDECRWGGAHGGEQLPLEEHEYWCGKLDADGCPTNDGCILKYSNMTGYHGNKCYNWCPVYCDETEVLCPGLIWDGCPSADYCKPADVGCPTVCPPTTDVQCGPDEFYCDMGWDNGCWMGSFCFAEECPAGTSPQQ